MLVAWTYQGDWACQGVGLVMDRDMAEAPGHVRGLRTCQGHIRSQEYQGPGHVKCPVQCSCLTSPQNLLLFGTKGEKAVKNF